MLKLIALFLGMTAVFAAERPAPTAPQAPSPDDPPWTIEKEPQDWSIEPPPLSHYAKPAAKLDPIADLKFKLRTMTYGEFIEAAEGLGFEPKKAWAWATEAA